MTTYNIFIFGHDFSKDEVLKSDILSLGIVFKYKDYEFREDYHGNKINGDYPLICGISITDDWDNKNYISEVRSATYDKYINDYNIFVDKFISDLNANKELEEEYDEVADRIIEFLKNNKPDFYSLEVTS